MALARRISQAAPQAISLSIWRSVSRFPWHIRSIVGANTFTKYGGRGMATATA
jgi:hypothetical protein